MNTTIKRNHDKFLQNSNTTWKILDEFPSYIITANGSIWSLKQGKFLSPSLDKKTGYLRVRLRNNEHNTINKSVHGLVARAFLGERPYNKNVNHINGIKTDNYWQNLEFLTQAQNVQHALDLGLIKTLDEHHAATKDNESIISALLEYFLTNTSKTKIGRKYGISIQYINRLLEGKLRKNIWNSPFLAPLKPF